MPANGRRDLIRRVKVKQRHQFFLTASSSSRSMYDERFHRLFQEEISTQCCLELFFLFGATAPHWARGSSFTRFLEHTQRRTTVGRTPLDEWSACRRDLYLTTHNTRNRQASMPPVGFEPITSAGERPQTYALESAATGTGDLELPLSNSINFSFPQVIQ